jgi:hypothetical protein
MAYVIYANEQQEGPLEEEEILLRLEAGVLSPADLIWDESSQSWLEIGQVLVIQTPGDPAPEVEAAAPETAPADLEIPASAETPAEAPAPDSEPAKITEAWTSFCQDKQKASVIRRIHPMAAELCALDEDILYMAVQRKPLLFYSPECLVLTDKRLFIFFKQLFKTSHHVFRWEEILNLQFKEGLFASHLTFKAGTGQAYGIYYLPKRQGRKAMQTATRLHEAARERFKKSHVPAPAPASKPGKAPPPRPKPEAQAAPPDPEAQLSKLKKLLEEQLITQEDYEQKKHEILSRL